jgi:16S rRNA U516 pseudouridylate synthase RsuA-like enzyme
MSERLNKYLAFQLGVSRREADNSIAAGHVQVNGTPAVLGGRFEDSDAITFKGKPLTNRGTTRPYIRCCLKNIII